MITIPLTRGKVALIDDEDFDVVKKYKWHACPSHRGLYAITNVRRNDKRTTIGMHRLILGLKGKDVCDHINHDGLDNRRSNLRAATPLENGRNKLRPTSNKSGYKGVFLIESSGMFRALIKDNAKQLHIGCFSCAEDAARAYDQKAEEIHGEFACLNFPKVHSDLFRL